MCSLVVMIPFSHGFQKTAQFKLHVCNPYIYSAWFFKWKNINTCKTNSTKINVTGFTKGVLYVRKYIINIEKYYFERLKTKMHGASFTQLSTNL